MAGLRFKPLSFGDLQALTLWSVLVMDFFNLNIAPVIMCLDFEVILIVFKPVGEVFLRGCDLIITGLLYFLTGLTSVSDVTKKFLKFEK